MALIRVKANCPPVMESTAKTLQTKMMPRSITGRMVQLNRIGEADADLRFIDYFDWDILGYIDCQYYRVRIQACFELPRAVGRDALIETHHATVLLDRS
jgi:hypothetical protein